MAVALLSATAGCQCNSDPLDGGADADLPDGDDGDRDAVADTRLDADHAHDVQDSSSADADADRDEGLRPDTGTTEELCGDEPSEWDWLPFECPDLDPPADCCPSCRRLTCRELAAWFYDVWEDTVVYEVRASVSMLDLNSGQDSIVLAQRIDNDRNLSFSLPAVSSRYVAARKLETQNSTIAQISVVAVSLTDRSNPELVVDDSPQNDVRGIDTYDQWVSWRRNPGSSDDTQLVLHNIDTGEQRILEDESWGAYDLFGSRIWGDRVVWATSGGVMKEHRISTGATREVVNDFDLHPMYYVSLWENYAVFTHEPYSAPWTVYLVDLDAGTVRPISPTDSTQDQSAIHGGRVVWTDYRGHAGGPGGMHVYVYSIATGREYPLNLSSRGGSEPVIFDRTIIWQGGPEPQGIWVTRIAEGI